MVPLFDPRPQHEGVRGEVQRAVQDVLDSGQFILGPNVQAFEEEVAAYHGVKHAIGVASGTDALHLALLAAGIGEGDEVITTPFSFIANLEAIYYCGATPVFADIDPRTMNLDPEAVAAVITDRTRAIMPVHLFGLPADMGPLMALAEKHGLRMVEDCAQAFGARYDGRPVGGIGDAGCFSFFPTKNLGGYGDGGLVTTDSDDLAESIRTLRNHGSRERYHHHEVGFNSRLDEVQAAALRVKFRHLEEFNESRRAVAAAYERDLAGLEIRLPVTPDGSHHVYGQYTIQVDGRDELRAALDAEGIGSAIYYPIPLHRQEVCEGAFRDRSFAACEAVAKTCMSLPMFPGMTDAQAAEVIAAVHKAVGD
jgi:dTDP-4-amino-4,6-dideoxygalactose transaminase